MTTLVELDLGNGTSVMIEVNEAVSVPRRAVPTVAFKRSARDSDAVAPFDALGEAMRGFADRAVGALREMDTSVERATLTFGLSLGGEAGVPYITKGRDAGALIVTLECNLAGQRARAEDAAASNSSP